MKLIFKEKHYSIESFSPTDLADFSVLTGFNGSGKSQLLQAIQQKNVEIEGFENANIVYFNYETFKMENEGAFNAQQISSERENAWNLFEQQIKSNISSYKNNLGTGHEQLTIICRSKEKKLWFLTAHDVEDTVLYAKLVEYKKQINIYFNNHFKGNQQAQAVFVLIKDIDYSLDEIEKIHFLELYRPYYFKSDFLPQQLGGIFWDYYIKLYQNQSNELQNERYGKNYPIFSEEDFIKKNGEKPWIVINKILEKFKNLDYKINSPEGTEPFNNFQLKLAHTKKVGLEIGFEHLSSGERVLMALVACIYKSTADNHFPDLLLLDEIDASLHPSMIKNLLEVINDIFLLKGMKVLLVTHSPTTVVIAPESSIFVMNKEGQNRIEKRTKEDALSILTEDFASLSQSESDLSISYNLSKAPECVVLTEGITDKIILEIAWNKIFPEEKIPFYIQDCFDATFLSNFISRGSEKPDGIFTKYSDKKFIALFDFDSEGFNRWNGIKNFYDVELNPRNGLLRKNKDYFASIMLLPVPDNLEIQKQVIDSGDITFKDKSHLPIELMFFGNESLAVYYKEEAAAGGGKMIKFIGNKRKFAENCNDLPVADFDNFKSIFNGLKNTFATYE